MRGESWTVERVELLRKLWGDGETAVAIAERLGGMSRSAVLGKIFRLRLPTADDGATGPKSAAISDPGETTAAPVRRRRGGGRVKRATLLPTKAAPRKTLLELTNTTCRCPMRSKKSVSSSSNTEATSRLAIFPKIF
jgi:GcrA cell cycle regulator